MSAKKRILVTIDGALTSRKNVKKKTVNLK